MFSTTRKKKKRDTRSLFRRWFSSSIDVWLSIGLCGIGLILTSLVLSKDGFTNSDGSWFIVFSGLAILELMMLYGYYIFSLLGITFFFPFSVSLVGSIRFEILTFGLLGVAAFCILLSVIWFLRTYTPLQTQ